MLSINIPTYNIEVVKLVKQLAAQAEALKIKYEIRVYDDGSDEIFKSINRSVLQVPNVVYVELKNNLGRSGIRNKMAKDTKFDLLLFMDADSKVVREDYLSKYIKNFNTKSVMCGGRTYTTLKPQNNEKIFHWTYGVKREAISAKKRTPTKGFFFMSNNFILEKKTFEKVHFREELQQYGHEDTLFGFDLICNGYKIVHVDNPLEHTGLESAQVFLKKSRLALENLHLITESLVEEVNDFGEQVNFLRKYNRIVQFIPVRLIGFLFEKFKGKLERNLKGKQPSLLLFDFYKLGYYTTIKNR
jgi:glycosyltransferase involved in cell wall biosynthesis